VTATFVIVHGGVGGRREWREVACFLEADGHEVTRPTQGLARLLAAV
jgi:hypothetical protein